jgi:ricin-type beta-trefoil lectin protein
VVQDGPDGDVTDDDQATPDRRLVRPYIKTPAPSLADEATFSGRADDGTAELPLVDDAAPAVPAESATRAPADNGQDGKQDDGQDGKQMVWLLGAGLTLIVATVVTMVTLWPGSDDQPSAAAPPSAFAWPAGKASGPPSAATPSASVRSSPSPSASSSPSPSPSSVPPSTPPSPPPSATLAPPPAADRVGPIVGPGGACLDVAAGIVLPGGVVATRDCNGTLSQRWTVATDGTLRVSGSCAAAGGAGQVTVGGCGSAASAQWRSGAGGTLVHVGSGLCLTGSAGNRVQVAACGAAGQSWALP